MPNLWDMMSPDVREAVLRVLVAIVALAVIWVARSLLTALLISPLRRLFANSKLGTTVLDVAETPIRFLILAFGLYVGAQILGASDVFIDSFTRTLVIVAIGAAIYRAVGVLALSRRQLQNFTGIVIEDELLPFVRTGLRLVVLGLALVIVLQQWGYDVSGLIAGLGLGGLAFSLAAQDTVANLFGFTAVVGDRPFVEGEFVKIGDMDGRVEQVGLRSTRVRRPDQSLVIIPNNKITSDVVINLSRLSRRQYMAKLLLDYNASSQQVRLLLARLRDMLETRPHVEKDSVGVFLSAFGTSALEVEVFCNVRLTDWMQFAREREEIHLLVMQIMEDLPVAFASSLSVNVEALPRISIARHGDALDILPEPKD